MYRYLPVEFVEKLDPIRFGRLCINEKSALQKKPGQVKELMFLGLTIEVGSDDEVVILEEAPPAQVLVRNEGAPADVLAAVALAAVIQHCSGSVRWLVPAGIWQERGRENALTIRVHLSFIALHNKSLLRPQGSCPSVLP